MDKALNVYQGLSDILKWQEYNVHPILDKKKLCSVQTFTKYLKVWIFFPYPNFQYLVKSM